MYLYLTDTHTHLQFDQYRKDLPGVIRRAAENNVKRILILGTDLDSSFTALKIARENEGIYAGMGIHPTEVYRSAGEDINKITEMASSEPKVVAIGEIGLDLHWKEVALQDQLRVLEKMMHVGSELNLPLVIHNREAQHEMQRFFNGLNKKSLRGVMHSFSGTVSDVNYYLQKGLHISFTGVVTFKNFRQDEVVKSVPLNRLLLETDSPFLAPVPLRGKRNEPSYVNHIAQKLSEIYNVSLQEIVRQTTENAARLFRWPAP